GHRVPGKPDVSPQVDTEGKRRGRLPRSEKVSAWAPAVVVATTTGTAGVPRGPERPPLVPRGPPPRGRPAPAIAAPGRARGRRRPRPSGTPGIRRVGSQAG